MTVHSHRRPTLLSRLNLCPSRRTLRAGVIATAVVAVVLGVQGLAAAATVTVKPGDTFSGLVAAHCGTSNWQAATFDGRDKNRIYAGETISFGCPGNGTQSAPAAPAAPSASGWVHPLPGYALTSCYGWRWGKMHQGIDFGAGYGTPPIRAVGHGTVVASGWNFGGYGISVVVHHGDGTYSHYAHMSSTAVSKGQWVGTGQTLGYVGSTGDSTGNHLHFEVWGGWWGHVEPASWLRARGVASGC